MTNILKFVAAMAWLAALVILLPRQAAGQQAPADSAASKQTNGESCAPVGVSSDWRTGLLRMANGVTSDKFVISRNTYRGCHGEDVYFETFHYLSAERARREFDDRIEGAREIVERRKKIDENGEVKAEMAVLLVAGDGKKPSAMIVIVSADLFRVVRSESLDDIFSIAKTLKP
jgi:hypothetical protein